MDERTEPQGLPAPAVHFDADGAAKRLYPAWEAAGYFRPQRRGRDRPAFTMVLPPPNVTGVLHMGHGLNATLQDILARFRRMDGHPTLWIPGADHASIALHWVLERALAKEGQSRAQLGREAFVARAWRYKEETEAGIRGQLRQLGVSCDFSRWRFTLDEGPARAVTHAFVKLWQDGLIYRAERMVNWDPVSQTTVSDLEVVRHEGVEGELAVVAYPLLGDHDEGDEALMVGTTRPETILADAALAVHPEDARFRHLIGRRVRNPLTDEELPVVGDAELVDPAMGTGVVKVTPAHDFNDHRAGQRHRLPAIKMLAKDGRLNAVGRELAGLTVAAARAQVLERLAQLGHLRERRRHLFAQPRSERSGAVLEPMLSWQWFVRARPLARPARAAVELGQCQLVPDSWRNTYFAWLDNVEDWCISRQLWWGHPIPAWHCPSCQALAVAPQAPKRCVGCGGAALVQDPDVLDTWFSSSLWPMSTLGWPDGGAAFSAHYPTQTLSTSYDIIFFWVARMMMMGHHFTGQSPFSQVFFHPLIKDSRGEKMSKTRGNVVDPGAMIESLGCDAFRLTLAALTGHGRELRWDPKRAEGYRRFVNKLWQAWRFIAGRLRQGDQPLGVGEAPPGDPFAAWILGRLADAAQAAREQLEACRFADLAQGLIRFFWEDFCDVYLEVAKVQLARAAGEDEAAPARRTLLTVLAAFCRLVHPIMPFVSEEIWQALPGAAGHVMVAPYPVAEELVPLAAALPAGGDGHAALERLLLLVTALRRARTTYAVPPRRPLTYHLGGQAGGGPAADDGFMATLHAHAQVVGALAHAELRPWPGQLPAHAAVETAGAWLVVVPLGEVIDLAAQARRMDQEHGRINAERGRLAATLAGADFLARAPAQVVLDKRRELAALDDRLVAIAGARARLGEPGR